MGIREEFGMENERIVSINFKESIVDNPVIYINGDGKVESLYIVDKNYEIGGELK